MAKLLEVNNLTTHFYTDNGVVEAVDGISYSVDEGEIVGIVGESGCGKSVSALSIMGLIPDPPGKIVAARSSSTDRTSSNSPTRRCERCAATTSAWSSRSL